MSQPPIPPAPKSPLDYASPLPNNGARVWAAIAIMAGGLTLIGIGGCFLIGVMLTLNGPFFVGGLTPQVSPGTRYAFITLLLLLAFASFIGGIWILLMGIRGLLGIVKA